MAEGGVGLDTMAEKNNGNNTEDVELQAVDELGNPGASDVRSGLDAFKQWMSLYVSYFESLRILSLKTRNQLKTSLIVSNPHHNCVSHPLNWHDAIRKFYDDRPPQCLTTHQADKAIQLLQSFINANLPQSRPLLVHFGKYSTEE